MMNAHSNENIRENLRESLDETSHKNKAPRQVNSPDTTETKDQKIQAQKKILDTLLGELQEKSDDIYYSSTMDVAHRLEDYIKESKELTQDEVELVRSLSAHDIQIILSYN